MPRDRIKNRVVGTQWHDNVVVDKLSTIQFPRFCRQQVWLGGKFDCTSLFLLSRGILFGKPREKHERARYKAVQRENQEKCTTFGQMAVRIIRDDYESSLMIDQKSGETGIIIYTQFVSYRFTLK